MCVEDNLNIANTSLINRKYIRFTALAPGTLGLEERTFFCHLNINPLTNACKKRRDVEVHIGFIIVPNDACYTSTCLDDVRGQWI